MSHDQNIVEISGKLGEVAGQLKALVHNQKETNSTLTAIVQDHERRISKNESAHSKVATIGGMIGAAAAFFGQYILKIFG